MNTVGRSEDRRWQHIPLGTTVVISRSWRTPAGPPNARYSEWADHQPGVEGEVIRVTNAGFRGLEYTVMTGEGVAHGIGADDLVLIDDELAELANVDEFIRRSAR